MGNNSKYTAEQIDFVRELARNTTRKETLTKFSERFGESLTMGKLTYLRKLAGIDCNYLDKPFGHNWTEPEKQWLRENVSGITTQELQKKFNEHFGLNLNWNQVRSQKKHLRLSSGLCFRFQKGNESYPRGTGYQHYFTKEQLQFIRENIKNSNIELARLFNEHFGTNLTPRKMYGAKHRHSITGAPVGSQAITFYSGYMKGRVHPDRFPEGTKRLWGKINPTPKCKTDNPGVWDSPGRVTWQKEYGEIPDGYLVRYLDGNQFNNAIENLELVSRSENAYINTKKLFVENPELNKTACLVAKVMSAGKAKASKRVSTK